MGECVSKVVAIGREKVRQTVDQLRLGEAEDNWRRERERVMTTHITSRCLPEHEGADYANLRLSEASLNCGVK